MEEDTEAPELVSYVTKKKQPRQDDIFDNTGLDTSLPSKTNRKRINKSEIKREDCKLVLIFVKSDVIVKDRTKIGFNPLLSESYCTMLELFLAFVFFITHVLTKGTIEQKLRQRVYTFTWFLYTFAYLRTIMRERLDISYVFHKDKHGPKNVIYGLKVDYRKLVELSVFYRRVDKEDPINLVFRSARKFVSRHNQTKQIVKDAPEVANIKRRLGGPFPRASLLPNAKEFKVLGQRMLDKEWEAMNWAPLEDTFDRESKENSQSEGASLRVDNEELFFQHVSRIHGKYTIGTSDILVEDSDSLFLTAAIRPIFSHVFQGIREQARKRRKLGQDAHEDVAEKVKAHDFDGWIANQRKLLDEEPIRPLRRKSHVTEPLLGAIGIQQAITTKDAAELYLFRTTHGGADVKRDGFLRFDSRAEVYQKHLRAHRLFHHKSLSPATLSLLAAQGVDFLRSVIKYCLALSWEHSSTNVKVLRQSYKLSSFGFLMALARIAPFYGLGDDFLRSAVRATLQFVSSNDVFMWTMLQTQTMEEGFTYFKATWPGHILDLSPYFVKIYEIIDPSSVLQRLRDKKDQIEAALNSKSKKDSNRAENLADHS